MNVKISYTVPFSEVPNQVDKLLIKVSGEFEQFKKKIEEAEALNEDHIIEKIKTIDDVRKKMLLLDLQLEDCYNILASYNKALADVYTPKATPESTQTQDAKSD